MKVRLFRCLIILFLIYNAEILILRREGERTLEIFEMRCLWTILGMLRRQWVQNKLIRKLLAIKETVVTKISKSRLRWVGHTIHKDKHSYIGWIYSQDFIVRRAAGKPPKCGMIKLDVAQTFYYSLPKEWYEQRTMERFMFYWLQGVNQVYAAVMMMMMVMMVTISLAHSNHQYIEKRTCNY